MIDKKIREIIEKEYPKNLTEVSVPFALEDREEIYRVNFKEIDETTEEFSLYKYYRNNKEDEWTGLCIITANNYVYCINYMLGLVCGFQSGRQVVSFANILIYDRLMKIIVTAIFYKYFDLSKLSENIATEVINLLENVNLNVKTKEELLAVVDSSIIIKSLERDTNDL